ncbi:hypothetical protein AnigIFM62618_010622 [Aspergillus niger]|nr:hypothetical protein AnigIFM62618_010622 [Aspergillus niger]
MRAIVIVTPENFGLAQAYIGNQTLGPDEPAYKALLVYSTSNVTYESIGKIRRFTEAGLPVILIGDPPQYATAGAASHQNFAEAISKLKRTKNVCAVSEGELFHNQDIQFAFVCNDGEASAGHLVVSSDKTPHRLDMWTVLSEPILEYQQAHGNTLTPLALEANQTAPIAFSGPSVHGLRAPAVHAVQTLSTIQGYKFSTNSSDSVELHVSAGPTDQPPVVSDGRNYIFPPGRIVASSFIHGNWSLTGEHWASPANLSDAFQIASKLNTTHQLDALVPWTQIPSLANMHRSRNLILVESRVLSSCCYGANKGFCQYFALF